MLALAREMGEARLEVVALNQLAVSVFHYESDVAKVRVLLEKALKVAEEAGLSEALAETQCNLGDFLTPASTRNCWRSPEGGSSRPARHEMYTCWGLTSVASGRLTRR